MRMSLHSVLAGAAAILAAASLTPAMAADGQVHVLTVQLPGGGMERIQYTGDVAPRVVLVPVPATMAAPMMMPDPFPALERISAMMHQQEAAMLRQVQALATTPDTALPGLPPGASGYSFVSTMSGSGVCMRSVRITYNGGNAAPRVVSSTSGDCGSGHGTQAPTEVNTPATIRPAPNTIEARATDGEAARQVAWNR
jgi:hypothetical protein